MSRTFGSRLGLSLRASRTSLALLVVGGVAAIACTTDYQKGVDDPSFGAPEALKDRKPPGRSSDLGGGGGDGGGGGGDDQPACVVAGGAIVDGGACAVTFADVWRRSIGLARKRRMCNAGSIYDPQPIDTSNPDGPTRCSLSAEQRQPLREPRSVDPAESSIYCNLDTLATCGTRMPSASTFRADLLSIVETWVKCGAPKDVGSAADGGM